MTLVHSISATAAVWGKLVKVRIFQKIDKMYKCAHAMSCLLLIKIHSQFRYFKLLSLCAVCVCVCGGCFLASVDHCLNSVWCLPLTFFYTKLLVLSLHASCHFIHTVRTHINYAKLMTEKPIHFAWKCHFVSTYPEQCWIKMIFYVTHRPPVVISINASSTGGKMAMGSHRAPR